MTKTALRATAAGFFFLTALACSGSATTSDGPGAAPATDEAAPEGDGLTQVPLIKGLKMKVPANAIGNKGAAGFHTEDKSFSVMIREVDPPTDMETAKASAEEFLFKSWIATDATDDGWEFTFEAIGLDKDQNQVDAWAFQIVKTIEGKQYRCGGSMKDKSLLEAHVEACRTLQKG